MTKPTTLWILKSLNLLAFLATIAVNAMANALPINGKTTGELSDLYPNLFVPAGLTFSIWGVIYLLLAIFAVYQIAAPSRNTTEFLQRIGPLFILASAANIGWIFLWHYQRVSASLIVMLVLLASLLAIYLRLGIGARTISWRERLLVQLPFSVYLGWITVATIANATAVLVHIGWNRFGASEVMWTVVVLIVATLITIAVLFTRNDLFYALVILWAFLGILIKRLAVDSPPSRAVLVTLAVTMAAIGIVLLLRIPRWLRG
ncbi:MAG: tryptophan-rich sensory protein [Spirochaetaceae bacterium]|nr:MAG: tryptophan-rich sensory protein [Spirochaetaceae bacterium]